MYGMLLRGVADLDGIRSLWEHLLRAVVLVALISLAVLAWL